MDVSVINFQIPTSGTTLDITRSGFGTPVAAMFWTMGGTNKTGTFQDHQSHGMGFTDGTNERAFAASAEDNQGTTDTHRESKNDRCLFTIDNTPSEDAGIGFNQWITDGVRVDLDATPSTAVECVCILFGGTGVEAVVGEVAAGTSTITTSIAQDIVFTLNNGAAIVGANAQALLSFGCAVDDGADTNRCLTSFNRNGVGGVQVTSRLSDTRAVVDEAVSLNWHCILDTFTATSFDQTSAGSTGSDEWAYLAINSNGASLDLRTVDSPTSTGNQKETTSFEVGSVIGAFSMHTATDSSENSGSPSECFGIAAADSTESWAGSFSDNDGAGTSDPSKVLDSSFPLVQDTGSVALEGSVSFQSDGYTINWTTVDGSARKGWCLAIEGSAGGGGSIIPQIMHHRRMMGVS